MDNVLRGRLEFADVLWHLHVGGQHRRLPVAVVAARDLGLITTGQAAARVRATLTEVAKLKSFDGFLYQWYDTHTGDVIRNPGDIDCATDAAPTFDNCYFISNVDNGWYASGLIVVREALPQLRQLADSLIAPMNFGIFYDGRAETHCNTNPAIQGTSRPGRCSAVTTSGCRRIRATTGRTTTQWRRSTATRGSRPTSAWACTRCRAMSGGGAGGCSRRLRRSPTAAAIPISPGRASGRWKVRGRPHRPAVGQQFSVWEGHYDLPGYQPALHPHLCRRDVRGG